MGDKGQAWIEREWTWDLVASRCSASWPAERDGPGGYRA